MKERRSVAREYRHRYRKGKPDFWQIDTVHHCGQTIHDEYLRTLMATDVFSSWIKPRSLLNGAQRWVFEAIADIKGSKILPVLEFHSDNGSEFVNKAAESWCRRKRRARCGSELRFTIRWNSSKMSTTLSGA
ncbi:MAG: transposase family protein [Treponema sp.]|nr:transposase family protein [Treponema sp.]